MLYLNNTGFCLSGTSFPHQNSTISFDKLNVNVVLSNGLSCDFANIQFLYAGTSYLIKTYIRLLNIQK